MKKNPLLIKKSHANGMKRKYAWRMLTLSLIGLFAIAFLTTISLVNPETIAGMFSCAGISVGSLCFLPFAANVKGIASVNGVDETDAEFQERKGKPETDEAFLKRYLKHLEAEIKAAGKRDFPELKEDLKALKEKFESIKGDSELLKALKEETGKINLAIEALKEGHKRQGSIKKQIYEFVKENADKIKELRKTGSGEIQLKVVAAMVTTSADSPDGIPDLVGVQVAPPSNVNLRSSIVDTLVSLFPTSLAAYPYTESLPKDGNYDFIAEKESKPQVDFKIETRYAQPKKVAAHMILSEESVTDIPNLQAIAYDYMRKKHDLKRQNGILFGDGTGDNLKGATVYGRAFVAGNMANRVTNPNFMDIVNAAITDIFTTHNYTDEMPYMANLVLINPIDFYTELVAAKDGFGRPLYPMASLFNKVVIGGATIIPYEDIPAGDIFVADMSKYNITDYVPYTIRIGWINDNFITNQFCIVGESRLHGFVKKLDEQAFIYDQIDDIKTAIQGA